MVEKKKINKLIKRHIINRPANAVKPFQMTLKLGNDEKYKSVLEVIKEFDQVYLKSVANSLGVIYEKIR